jgi:hypothetical protein
LIGTGVKPSRSGHKQGGIHGGGHPIEAFDPEGMLGFKMSAS